MVNVSDNTGNAVLKGSRLNEVKEKKYSLKQLSIIQYKYKVLVTGICHQACVFCFQRWKGNISVTIGLDLEVCGFDLKVLLRSLAWFSLSCLKKFQDFPKPPKRFSRTLYTAHPLLNLLYMTSSTANTLDQVHCIQRWNTQIDYTWNNKYFKIHCHYYGN